MTPETAVRIYINPFSCFLTMRGALTYDSSHNCGSSLCITTGLDLGSVSPEYKLIQKKKKKKKSRQYWFNYVCPLRSLVS